MAPTTFTRRSFCGLAAALALVRPATSAARVFAADGALDFVALRNGVEIGRRRQAISRASGDLVMRLDQELLIGPAAQPLHRLTQHVEEIWREGWLHALVSDSESDGQRWQVRAERRDGIFGGAVNGRRFTVSGYAITSSFWHRDTPSQEALLDVTDGRVKSVRGSLVGEETLDLAGQSLRTRHFLLQGQIAGHLWYDREARLVRLRRPLRDGSDVLYEVA